MTGDSEEEALAWAEVGKSDNWFKPSKYPNYHGVVAYRTNGECYLWAICPDLDTAIQMSRMCPEADTGEMVDLFWTACIYDVLDER